jgi:hypothetical protein
MPIFNKPADSGFDILSRLGPRNPMEAWCPLPGTRYESSEDPTASVVGLGTSGENKIY